MSGRDAVLRSDQMQYRTCLIQDRDMFDANNARPVDGFAVTALNMYNASDALNFNSIGLADTEAPTKATPTRSITLLAGFSETGDPNNNVCQGIAYNGDTGNNFYETQMSGLSRRQYEACAQQITDIASELNLRCSK